MDDLSRTIAGIYECCADPHWAEYLHSIQGKYGAHSSALWFIDNQSVELVSSTIAPEALDLYKDRVHNIDPWAPKAARSPSLHVHIGEELCAERDLLRSEFYSDYGKPYDIGRVVGSTLPISGSGALLTVVLQRCFSAGPFSEQTRAELSVLMPHFQRAGRIIFRNLEIQRQYGDARRYLASLPAVMLVLDRRDRLVTMSASADEFLRREKAIRMVNEQLRLRDPMLNSQLHRIVYNVRKTRIEGALVVGNHNGPRFIIRVLLPTLGPLAAGELFILIDELTLTHRDLQQKLKITFSLSEAETDVAMLLLDGVDAKTIALRRKVATSTIRTQIRSILEKAGLSKQAQFVAKARQLIRSV